MKRGAEPIQGSVSTVIMSLLILIVVIIMFMPPCERCRLLHDNNECLDECEGIIEYEDILLHEYPGDISEDEVKEYELGSLNLFFKDEPEIKTLSSSLKIERSIFGDSYQELSFRIDDIENLKDLTLYFNVLNPKGDLIIELNNHLIFNGFKRAGIAEVILPTDYISETNSLKISVTTGFLVKNHYTLNDVKIKKVYELRNSAGTKTFSVSSTEKKNIDDSELSFFMYCKELRGEGRFKLYFNNQELVNEPLICSGSKREIDLDDSDFETGRNVLEFVVDKGDFLFNDITVRNEFDESFDNQFEYEFDIDDDQDERIDDGEDVVLEMELDDINGVRKVADIKINGYVFEMNTDSDSFERDITKYIEEGNNDLEIIPKTDFEIIELTIKLED